MEEPRMFLILEEFRPREAYDKARGWGANGANGARGTRGVKEKCGGC